MVAKSTLSAAAKRLKGAPPSRSSAADVSVYPVATRWSKINTSTPLCLSAAARSSAERASELAFSAISVAVPAILNQRIVDYIAYDDFLANVNILSGVESLALVGHEG